jgi:subtilisin family serine protease
MAAPHVSGVAALLLAADPSLTASQLRSRLTTFAIDLGAPGRDDQSFGPVRQVLVRLMDQTTGALLQTTLAQPNGAYAFTELPDGNYLVFAGQDADGDQIIGVPTRTWGGFGGSATPAAVTVDGAGTYDATFAIGFPIEVEPNDDAGTTNLLMVGGYLRGTSSTVSDPDAFRVVIPTDGQYTFETVAVDGACGFALEEDTLLRLYDAQGNFLFSNDDIDASNWNFCSRVSTTLTAGTYYVAVWGWIGNFRRYALIARPGT